MSSVSSMDNDLLVKYISFNSNYTKIIQYENFYYEKFNLKKKQQVEYHIVQNAGGVKL